MSKTIIIIGAGLAGLSAALQAAENGCNVKLVSSSYYIVVVFRDPLQGLYNY